MSSQIPTFAELTSPGPDSQITNDNHCPEGIAAATQWLQHIERECARVRADHKAGQSRIKFDMNAVYRSDDEALCEKFGIDYVAIILLHNEMCERNPFTPQQIMQERRRRKEWLDNYVTEARLSDKIGIMIEAIIRLKKEQGFRPETAVN
jgi:hypothetical protein